jgi:hypothetical protein
MKPEILIIIFKGVGMVMAFIGGIIIANYGYRLFKNGAGHKRDLIVFEYQSFKLTAHSVGSIVMASAFLWAWAGVLLSPNLERKNDSIRIFSFQTPEITVETGALSSDINVSNLNIEKKPNKLNVPFKRQFISKHLIKIDT